jgi:hypothetical protein
MDDAPAAGRGSWAARPHSTASSAPTPIHVCHSRWRRTRPHVKCAADGTGPACHEGITAPTRPAVLRVCRAETAAEIRLLAQRLRHVHRDEATRLSPAQAGGSSARTSAMRKMWKDGAHAHTAPWWSPLAPLEMAARPPGAPPASADEVSRRSTTRRVRPQRGSQAMRGRRAGETAPRESVPSSATHEFWLPPAREATGDGALLPGPARYRTIMGTRFFSWRTTTPSWRHWWTGSPRSGGRSRASGGRARAARRREHDVLVLDIGLPGIDGQTLTRQLRRATRAVPILMLTARAGVEDRVEGLDAGAGATCRALRFELWPACLRSRAGATPSFRPSSTSATSARSGALHRPPGGGRGAHRRSSRSSVPHAHTGELVTRSALLKGCWDELRGVST